MKNKVILSAAGSGKTTFIVKKALEIKNQTVLITTFTQNNYEEIKIKILENNNGVFPKNIYVKTWFSFLLDDGVKPYRYNNSPDNVGGVNMNNPFVNFKKESNVKEHYFDTEDRIFSNYISKYVIKRNDVDNKLIERMKKIYENIFVDEVQDMSGYDLELFKLLNINKFKMMLVGDLRQTTYKTNHNPKNKKIKNDLELFFKKNNFEIDNNTLNQSHRNHKVIFDFANQIHNKSDGWKMQLTEKEKNNHLGVFLIKEQDLDFYLKKYKPTQLRHNKIKIVNNNYDIFNFGSSKGMEFERVIIYPTEPIKKWIKGDFLALKDDAKCKFYVAITRAKYSVGILWDNTDKNHQNLPIFKKLEREEYNHEK